MHRKLRSFSNEEVELREIPDLHIASRRMDPSFKEWHYFTVNESTLAREAKEYWGEVNNVAIR
jgi:hypothetical protein